MKIKEEKIAIPSKLGLKPDPMEPITKEDIINNEAMIKKYIKSSRQHLENLKAELYHVVDTGYENAEHYYTQGSEANFNVVPSFFLEKAYTIQTFDEKGEAIRNRDQLYIDAGTDFSKYCSKKDVILDQDKLLLNDAGIMIGSINSAISQLNKTEASLKKKEYETAGGEFQVVPTYIKGVLGNAKKSKLVEMVPNSIIRKILSALSDIVSNITNFFSNLGKSKLQQDTDKFNSYKKKYDAKEKAQTNNSTTTPDPEESSPQLK